MAITINANANDSNGTITQVTFYADGAVIGISTSSPYSCTWTNAPLGTHSLTSAAIDNSGAITTSSAVNITVYDIPVCTMTAPQNNYVYTTPPASITLSASVTNIVGTISSVKFYDCTQGNTTLLYTATSSPYNYTWTSPAAGKYTLTALATDSYGATASSAVNITVDNITCSMTAPTNGKVYSQPPSSITLLASVTDTVGTVSSVKFYDCTQGNTTLLYTATSSPYNYTWTSPAAGKYTLTALATDSYGATASSAVNITVDNITCSMTAPANNSVYIAPSTITLSASVTDTVGTVSSVKFYDCTQGNTTLLYTATSSPYNYTWTSPACRDIYPDSAGH